MAPLVRVRARIIERKNRALLPASRPLKGGLVSAQFAKNGNWEACGNCDLGEEASQVQCLPTSGVYSLCQGGGDQWQRTGGPRCSSMSELSYKDQGNDEFKKGNFLKAAGLYSKAIQQEPEDAVLYRCSRVIGHLVICEGPLSNACSLQNHG